MSVRLSLKLGQEWSVSGWCERGRGPDLRFCEPCCDDAEDLYVRHVGVVEAGRVDKDHLTVVIGATSDDSNFRRAGSETVTDALASLASGVGDELSARSMIKEAQRKRPSGRCSSRLQWDP